MQRCFLCEKFQYIKQGQYVDPWGRRLPIYLAWYFNASIFIKKFRLRCAKKVSIAEHNSENGSSISYIICMKQEALLLVDYIFDIHG